MPRWVVRLVASRGVGRLTAPVRSNSSIASPCLTRLLVDVWVWVLVRVWVLVWVLVYVCGVWRCTYTCIHTHIHIYIYTYIHIYIYTCIHVYMYTCIHVIYKHIYSCVYVDIGCKVGGIKPDGELAGTKSGSKRVRTSWLACASCKKAKVVCCASFPTDAVPRMTWCTAGCA